MHAIDNLAQCVLLIVIDIGRYFEHVIVEGKVYTNRTDIQQDGLPHQKPLKSFFPKTYYILSIPSFT